MRLTEAQKDEIRRRYRPGAAGRPKGPLQPGTTRALALEFRVSQTHVRRILKSGPAATARPSR